LGRGGHRDPRAPYRRLAVSDTPLLIWGAGAIGGTIGAYLARAGHEVLFVDTAPDHIARINENGLTITGPIDSFTVPAKAVPPEALNGIFDRVVLAVKTPATRAAAHALAPHLASNGYVVSAQNGLNEPLIAEVVGSARTLGCFVNFGADYLAPGEILYGGRGAAVVGEIDGQVTERVRALESLLQDFEPNAISSANIFGYLWSKMAYGAMLFAEALTEASIADCLDHPAYRELFIALAREVLAVAQAQGVVPEPFNGFDPAAFLPGGGDRAARASLDTMVAFNRRSAKTHSGIWRDIAVRKRRTEVDALPGAVAALALAQGLGASLCARLTELIHEVEDGKRPQSWQSLDALKATMA
jgi:2-dehydropantoate 2-reductase